MFELVDFQLRDEESISEPEREKWIAARYDGLIPKEMFLGDGSKPGTGEFFNNRLILGQQYKVFVRAFADGNVSELLLSFVMPSSVLLMMST